MIARFQRRGLYLHLCWKYRRPYAARQWTDQDWADFFDWCVGIGYNRFMVWPLVEAYMDRHRRADQLAFSRINNLIARAKRRHPHVEFWGVVIPNCITEQRFNEPLLERDFFAAMRPVDPRSRREMAIVERRRATVLEWLPAFDGWAMIDGDPGGWPHRPVSDFVDVMARFQQQLRPPTKLIYWLWSAWGRGPRASETKADRWQKYIQLLDDRLGAEHWHPLAGAESGELLAKLGRSPSATRLCYSAVELEPSPPFTHTDAGSLDEVVRNVRREGPWAGLMVNAQSHAMQLPRIWYAARLMLGEKPRLYNAVPTLAGGWRNLRRAWTGSLRRPNRRSVRVPRARHLFDRRFHSADCAQQAQVIMAARSLAATLRDGDTAGLREAMLTFLRHSYARFQTTGYYGALSGTAFCQWWNYAGMPPPPLLEEIRAAWDDFIQRVSGERIGWVGQIISEVHAELVQRRVPPLLAATMIHQLLGAQHPLLYLTDCP